MITFGSACIRVCHEGSEAFLCLRERVSSLPQQGQLGPQFSEGGILIELELNAPFAALERTLH